MPVSDIEKRLDEIEARLAAIDTMVRFVRWVAPILVGIAGVVVGRLT